MVKSVILKFYYDVKIFFFTRFKTFFSEQITEDFLYIVLIIVLQFLVISAFLVACHLHVVLITTISDVVSKVKACFDILVENEEILLHNRDFIQLKRDFHVLANGGITHCFIIMIFSVTHQEYV